MDCDHAGFWKGSQNLAAGFEKGGMRREESVNDLQELTERRFVIGMILQVRISIKPKRMML